MGLSKRDARLMSENISVWFDEDDDLILERGESTIVVPNDLIDDLMRTIIRERNT